MSNDTLCQYNKPDIIQPTRRNIESRRSPNGGYFFDKETLASWGVPWPPPKGWRTKLEEQADLNTKREMLYIAGYKCD